MALSVVDAGHAPHARTPIDWMPVQAAQFEHDETYHREISRLPMQARLRHMALHFAKYAGRLQEDISEKIFKQTATDALVIAISSANTLNIRISDNVEKLMTPQTSREAYIRRLSICAGKMAAACEKLDHLEDFPFRKTIESEVLAIFKLSADLFAREGWNPVVEMQARLAPLKTKSIFHRQS